MCIGVISYINKNSLELNGEWAYEIEFSNIVKTLAFIPLDPK